MSFLAHKSCISSKLGNFIRFCDARIKSDLKREIKGDHSFFYDSIDDIEDDNDVEDLYTYHIHVALGRESYVYIFNSF